MNQITLVNNSPIAEIGNGCFLTLTYSAPSEIDRKSTLTVRKMDEEFNPAQDISDVLESGSGILINDSGDCFYEAKCSAEEIEKHDSTSFGADWTNHLPKYVPRLLGMTYDEHVSSKKFFPIDQTHHSYWDYQPLRIPMIDNHVLFLYMPLGTVEDLQMVVVENGVFKQQLQMELRKSTDPIEFTSNWAVYWNKANMDDDLNSYEPWITLVFVNVVKKNGEICLYHCSFDFNWPRILMSLCCECSVETNGSQLCGGGHCIAASTVEGFPPEKARDALKRMIWNHRLENQKKALFHISCEKIQTEALCPDTFGYSKMHVGFCMPKKDHLLVCVGKHVYEIYFILNEIDEVYETQFLENEEIACVSKMYNKRGYFHYITSDGDLVVFGTLAQKKRQQICNLVPINALSTVKLFYVRRMLLCYYFLDEMHFVVNINESMIQDI